MRSRSATPENTTASDIGNDDGDSEYDGNDGDGEYSGNDGDGDTTLLDELDSPPSPHRFHSTQLYLYCTAMRYVDFACIHAFIRPLYSLPPLFPPLSFFLSLLVPYF